MRDRLELLMNYMQSVVRTDEERLRLAMEAYVQGEPAEQRKAA